MLKTNHTCQIICDNIEDGIERRLSQLSDRGRLEVSAMWIR